MKIRFAAIRRLPGAARRALGGVSAARWAATALIVGLVVIAVILSTAPVPPGGTGTVIGDPSASPAGSGPAATGIATPPASPFPSAGASASQAADSGGPSVAPGGTALPPGVTATPGSSPIATAVPTPRVTPRPTPRPTLPPPPPVNGTFSWGMWTGQPWGTGQIKSAISMVGHTPAVLMTYQGWDRQAQYLSADAQAIKNLGAAWMVTWEPSDSLQGIAAGHDDSFISGWAKAAKSWGGTIYLRYMHEMNGDWYPWGVYNGHNGNSPADFVNAWKHTHDLFVAAGATNVKWVFSPNVRYGSNYPFANLYPGSSYVDMIALDGYNWGGQVGGHPGWQSMASIFQATYSQVLAYGKPIVIAETASAEGGGDKAAWITASYFTDIPKTMPRISSVIWFNQSAETDFRINSSASSLAAFQQMAGSSAWHARFP